MTYRHVVALGSSFAAGPGIPPVVDAAAGRSGANYAHLFADAIGARLTDLTVSGATTATVLDQPQRVGRTTFPPQLSGVPEDADLVTVTVGGNDLGYLQTMLRLAWANQFQRRWWTRAAGNRLARGPVPVADPDIVVGGLTAIVDAVHERAPGARVVLVDYLTLLEEKTVPPFTDVQHRALRALGRRVSGAFAVAAQATGAGLVQASVLSAGHGVGTAEPWVNGFVPSTRRATSAFHPNAAGMRAIADELVRTLGART
ncbi:SGNH/GDSL hydrolase family protein [Cryptosporangium phraense]|uniref:SGNH/GDSL hydrolase family protein n=1 Tax=Cryptosporangium phraense TaxID=2593070 RepID=A0A545ARQ6_9ACTN|nr:SGNH/GDSL hydrolase family protein [Cryptosporangium phraense]TQS44002.1 SGNH/GDSL hydrolase family protein [Cryptosporangium phraense]